MSEKRRAVVVRLAAVFALSGLLCVSRPCGWADNGSAGQPNPAPAATVTIVAPEANCSIAGGEVLKVMVVSTAQDISAVAIMCDDKGIAMLQAPPFLADWNTAGVASGKHVLRAQAYLKSGDKLSAEPVVVEVVAPPAALASSPLPVVAEPVTVKEGTPVFLRTMESMTSGRIAEGAGVRLTVGRDVRGPGGRVLIAYGADAYGKVTESNKRGMLGKQGRLAFTVERVEAVDGTSVPLRAQLRTSGKSNKGTVVAAALLLTVLAVFVHGRDVTIPADTEVVGYVDSDTVINQPGAAQPGVQGPTAPEESVAITSPADGRRVVSGLTVRIRLKVQPADQVAGIALYLDDKQVGQPVTSLEGLSWDSTGVQAGEHKLRAEVTFRNGLVLPSAPVTVNVVEGAKEES